MELETKIVHFHEYCETCKYKDVKEEDDPCYDCLNEAARSYSHKPLNYKNKDEI